MTMVGLAVTLAYLAYIALVRGCFLFPCLCAPTVPGWLFLPTADPPDFDWGDVGATDRLPFGDGHARSRAVHVAWTVNR